MYNFFINISIFGITVVLFTCNIHLFFMHINVSMSQIFMISTFGLSMHHLLVIKLNLYAKKSAYLYYLHLWMYYVCIYMCVCIMYICVCITRGTSQPLVSNLHCYISNGYIESISTLNTSKASSIAGILETVY